MAKTEETSSSSWYKGTTPLVSNKSLRAAAEPHREPNTAERRMYGKTTPATKGGRVAGTGPGDHGDPAGNWYGRSTPKEGDPVERARTAAKNHAPRRVA